MMINSIIKMLILCELYKIALIDMLSWSDLVR